MTQSPKSAALSDTPGAPPGDVKHKSSGRRLDAGCIFLFAATSLFVFRGAFMPSMTIEGADASLWVPRFVQQWTEYLFVPRWFPHFLAGFAQQFQFLSHGIILMLLAPPQKFHGLEFMLDIFLAGTFMFLFLRDIGLGRFGALVGGFSYQLGNGLLTSVHQGALWRLDTACWTPLFLLFFFRLIGNREHRLKNSFFAGIALGLQFLGGEVQLAYYVCLLALAYFVLEAAKDWISDANQAVVVKTKSLMIRTVAAAFAVAIAAVFAAEVFQSYAAFMTGNENVGGTSAEDNWKFATEFSFPPEETLSLILTGSIFPTGARVSPGITVQRLTDDYLGILVVLFAALGLFSGRRRRYFFAIAAGVSLLIAFGKYFPLPYRLVYQLPLMKGLRNPHKWLFITALCIPVLAGMGADYWAGAPSRRNRQIVILISAFGALVVLAALFAPTAARWSRHGPVSGGALIRPAAVLAMGSLLLLFGRRATKPQTGLNRAVMAALVLLLAGDLICNASRYVMYYNYQKRYVENEVGRFLSSQPQPFRVKLWVGSHYLRFVATEVLPYEGIDTVDAIMSRRPRVYSDIFRALREKRLPLSRYFQLFNVRFVLSAAEIPNDDIALRPVRSFQQKDESGHEAAAYLYEFPDFLPRAFVVDDFVVARPDETIARLADANLDLGRTVILEKEPGLQKNASAGAEELSWSIHDFVNTPNRATLDVNLNKPGILTLLNHMDEHWRVRVDGQAGELLRADYLMGAVALPAGTHHVEFLYCPPRWGYWMTLGMWAFLLLLLSAIGIRKSLKNRRRNIEGEA